MPQVDSIQKDNTRRFLEGLQETLNAELPPLDHLRSKVRQTAAASKEDSSRAHLRGPESAFLNSFVIPKIFDQMQRVGIGATEARRAFLCEGYANPDLSRYCSGTPARSERHPFTKIVNTDALEITRKWKGGNGSPLTQACPDFAFRDPFPFKIVFEGKYFEQGRPEKAARDLATHLYQAFFYRSLPYAAPNGSGAPWDYDYACLLAYDASPDAALVKVWNELAEPVREGFWKGANVYVMILRSVAS
jgi:hypothetical protein